MMTWLLNLSDIIHMNAINRQYPGRFYEDKVFRRTADGEPARADGGRREKTFEYFSLCRYNGTGLSIKLPVPAYPGRAAFFTCCLLQALGCTPEGTRTGAMPADADGDGMLTLKETADCVRALHEELRNTLPDDFPFQIFQFRGEEDTVLFRR